jgi:hypothetical protein
MGEESTDANAFLTAAQNSKRNWKSISRGATVPNVAATLDVIRPTVAGELMFDAGNAKFG